MGIAVSILLIAVGAILTWGVTAEAEGLDVNAIGVILMIVGLLGLVISMIFWSSWGGFQRRTRLRRGRPCRASPRHAAGRPWSRKKSSTSLPVRRLLRRPLAPAETASVPDRRPRSRRSSGSPAAAGASTRTTGGRRGRRSGAGARRRRCGRRAPVGRPAASGTRSVLRQSRVRAAGGSARSTSHSSCVAIAA